MIHPSYVELMKVLNDDVIIGEEPVVNSRYSIVCAAAKRARQLIDGSDSYLVDRQVYGRKPLSIAVQELSDGHLKILSAEEAEEEQGRLDELLSENREIREKVEELREKNGGVPLLALDDDEYADEDGEPGTKETAEAQEAEPVDAADATDEAAEPDAEAEASDAEDVTEDTVVEDAAAEESVDNETEADDEA